MEEFSRRVSPGLVGALLLQYGSQALAEDIAQEAMVRAWERWSDVSAVGDRERWTFRVAFTIANSGLRRRAAERRALSRSHRSEVTDDHDRGDAIAVRHALLALPQRQRQAIVLRYYAQLSAIEAGDVMGCAAGTVRALTSQGLATLRSILTFEDPMSDQRLEPGDG